MTTRAIAAARGLIGLLLPIIGSALFFRLGAAAGMPILLFAISLACAGPGNRALWSLAFAVLTVLSTTAFTAFERGLAPGPGLWMTGLHFAVLPLVPALFLWLAHRFRAWRQARVPATTKAPAERDPTR
jgi:hypothetical protein